MTHRKELEVLLDTYETYIGTGNMKQAGRTLPKIIRKLVMLFDEQSGYSQATDIQKEYQDFVKVSRKSDGKKVFSIDAGSMSPDEATAHIAEVMGKYKVVSPEPCEPCDVSLEKNEKLIEEFKTPVVEKKKPGRKPGSSVAKKAETVPAPKTRNKPGPKKKS